jgi:hypothetical protein
LAIATSFRLAIARAIVVALVLCFAMLLCNFLVGFTVNGAQGDGFFNHWLRRFAD